MPKQVVVSCCLQSDCRPNNKLRCCSSLFLDIFIFETAGQQQIFKVNLILLQQQFGQHTSTCINGLVAPICATLSSITLPFQRHAWSRASTVPVRILTLALTILALELVITTRTWDQRFGQIKRLSSHFDLSFFTNTIVQMCFFKEQWASRSLQTEQGGNGPKAQRAEVSYVVIIL